MARKPKLIGRQRFRAPKVYRPVSSLVGASPTPKLKDKLRSRRQKRTTKRERRGAIGLGMPTRQSHLGGAWGK